MSTQDSRPGTGSSKRGRFITIEGVEGVGKSTNLTYTADYLRGRGLKVVETREPGGTPVAEAIRNVLLEPDAVGMSDLCELLLVFAARASHLDRLIRPALERGEWVVCDRFTDATFAYQGGGRGLRIDTIAQLERLVQGDMRPDLTILLDASLEVAQDRRRLRGSTDRFEAEAAAFFMRVQDAYRSLARAEPERIRQVDAGQPLAAVQTKIAEELARFIELVS